MGDPAVFPYDDPAFVADPFPFYRELREGGPVLAAMFLQEFAGDGPWAHVDMAGPGFVQRKRPDYILDEGGTGYGVRLIVELAQALASA